MVQVGLLPLVDEPQCLRSRPPTASHPAHPLPTPLKVGLPLGGEPPVVPMARVAGREIEIIGSHGLDAADMPKILQLVASGRLDPTALIERRVGLEEGARAIEAMDKASPLGITMVTHFR